MQNLEDNALQEAVIIQRGDSFVLPVKSYQSGQILGIVHDSSASGSTSYLEPKSGSYHRTKYRGQNFGKILNKLEKNKKEWKRDRRQVSEWMSRLAAAQVYFYESQADIIA